MSQRKMNYLNVNRIVYRRNPVTDVPTSTHSWGWFYKQGTHQCYSLFQTDAKINTYKSLRWHLYVLWYLNPQLKLDQFKKLSEHIINLENNFITFTIDDNNFNNILSDVMKYDLERPPKNKLRKVIFKDQTGLDKFDKLKIVGKMIGRQKVVDKRDIYETMLFLNDTGKKITISKIANIINCSTRTIYRNMCEDLNLEKDLLNNSL
tara:strand:+ start:1038 stop:1655 length:618 start_codon:yes stop_codon:yes gene_type:complete